MMMHGGFYLQILLQDIIDMQELNTEDQFFVLFSYPSLISFLR